MHGVGEVKTHSRLVVKQGWINKRKHKVSIIAQKRKRKTNIGMGVNVQKRKYFCEVVTLVRIE